MKVNTSGSIPAPLRYEKKIPAGAKLLYAEISALSRKYGYCYASNRHFSESFGVSRQTVSGWISLLVKAGFLQSEVKQNYQRKIFPLSILEETATIKSETSASPAVKGLQARTQPVANFPEEIINNSSTNKSTVHKFQEWIKKNLSPGTIMEIEKANLSLTGSILTVNGSLNRVGEDIVKKYFSGMEIRVI